MLFADDSIIFLEGSHDDLESLKDILRKYEVRSGQKVNPQKSSSFFGKVCLEEDNGNLKQANCIESKALSERYLDLRMVHLSMLRNVRRANFQDRKDRASQRPPRRYLEIYASSHTNLYHQLFSAHREDVPALDINLIEILVGSSKW